MKSKYNIGDVFNCYGSIIVVTGVTISSYKPSEHLYKFKFLHKDSSNILNSLPFNLNYDDSDLANFKRIKL